MAWRLFASWREFTDYLILLGTAALGFAGAPWWSIIGSACALFSLGWERWNELGLRAKRSGAADVFTLVMSVRFAFACAAAASAFLVGSALRWMADL